VAASEGKPRPYEDVVSQFVYPTQPPENVPRIVRGARWSDQIRAVVAVVQEEFSRGRRDVAIAIPQSSPSGAAIVEALIAAAKARDLPYVFDDTLLTLGAGTGSADFRLEDLPAVTDVQWARLHDIPTAIVTGSNGKTTTVRLLAACSRAHGWRAAYSSTDGVFLDGDLVDAGGGLIS